LGAKRRLAGRQALQRLASREAALGAEQQAERDHLAAAQARRDAFEAQTHRLAESLGEARRAGFAALQKELQTASEQARARLAELQADPSVRAAHRAQQALRQASLQAGQQACAPAAAPAAAAPALGDWVYVVPLGKVGQLTELEGQRAQVTMGALRVRQTLSNLRPAPPPKTAGRAAPPQRSARAAPPPGASGPCDVRGLRPSDARRLVAQHLEQLVHDGQSQLVVRHGLGTGALRQAVREELQLSPYVVQLADGAAAQGGAAVTVADLQ
ncbi:MAG: hypothetical protein EOO78_11335, partial [Oxalobacteraceae bacterium]